MQLSDSDARLLIEALAYHSFGYSEESRQAMRCRSLVREIAAEHGLPDPFSSTSR